MVYDTEFHSYNNIYIKSIIILEAQCTNDIHGALSCKGISLCLVTVAMMWKDSVTVLILALAILDYTTGQGKPVCKLNANCILHSYTCTQSCAL